MASACSLRSAPLEGSSTHSPTVAAPRRGGPRAGGTSSPTGASRSRGGGSSLTPESWTAPTLKPCHGRRTPTSTHSSTSCSATGGGILGENLAGAYIQGSFALGAGDMQSDCDWIVAHSRAVDRRAGRVASRDPRRDPDAPTAAAATGSRAPTRRSTSWPRSRHLGREMAVQRPRPPHAGMRDDHCNRAYTRWILREHGITLYRPGAAGFHAARTSGPAAPRGVRRDPDADGRPGDLGRHRRDRVGPAVCRGDGLPDPLHARPTPRWPARPVRWSGPNGPSTRAGGRCWARSPRGSGLGPQGPAAAWERGKRRGFSRRTPWSWAAAHH